MKAGFCLDEKEKSLNAILFVYSNIDKRQIKKQILYLKINDFSGKEGGVKNLFKMVECLLFIGALAGSPARVGAGEKNPEPLKNRPPL